MSLCPLAVCLSEMACSLGRPISVLPLWAPEGLEVGVAPRRGSFPALAVPFRSAWPGLRPAGRPVSSLSAAARLSRPFQGGEGSRDEAPGWSLKLERVLRCFLLIKLLVLTVPETKPAFLEGEGKNLVTTSKKTPSELFKISASPPCVSQPTDPRLGAGGACAPALGAGAAACWLRSSGQRL